eukprot:CAMPEP_0201269336 /NCGR_PEP_ID=MMETSP0853-20130426/32310_1 /ASSEMBLY_ACC=CAM_ASM_000640 /TAXON_ID=183588 /ORGANISM="Pseudo-nitzschia fraudulenta, Strain WWA7" /LENGTH=305 /DNA_ID=CAMNT_0047575313 /DNA_START=40 /DNA_END=957 /DNA_ORIENTATION=+
MGKTHPANDEATTDATNGVSTSFIITGFGPFAGVEDNPTTVIVRRLDSYLRSLETSGDGETNKEENDHETKKKLSDLVKEYVVLETSAQDVCETMDRIRKEHINDIVVVGKKDGNKTEQRILLLHLGVARSKSFRLEACAYNEATFRVPDQRGYQPDGLPIVSDTRHEVGKAYATPLDLEALREQMAREFPKISTIVSENPGRYVCNFVYCKSLEISLPFSASNNKTGVASVGLEPITKAKSVATIPGNEQDKNDLTTANDNEEDVNHDTNLVCNSLFLHVPHFDIVPEEEQISYVAGLLRNLTT